MVRRVTEDDWRLLRAVRLEMLADTPLAYLETVDDAEARSEGEWRFRAGRGSAGGLSVSSSRGLSHGSARTGARRGRERTGRWSSAYRDGRCDVLWRGRARDAPGRVRPW